MHGQRSRRAAVEAVGTFFLVLIGPGAAAVDAHSSGVVTHVGISIAFAFIVAAMVFAFGHVSGAHINPAVTIAFWSARRFPTGEVLPYIAAQCAGAIAAAGVLRAILGDAVAASATLPAVPALAAFGIEWLLSFLLMLVIMAAATNDRLGPGAAALAIGFTVGCGALMSGPLTGGSFNPARSFGPAVVAGEWRGHWLYWLAPITGMIAAARFYGFVGGRASLPSDSGQGLPSDNR